MNSEFTGTRRSASNWKRARIRWGKLPEEYRADQDARRSIALDSLVRTPTCDEQEDHGGTRPGRERPATAPFAASLFRTPGTGLLSWPNRRE
jgi:hypothetical protein